MPQIAINLTMIFEGLEGDINFSGTSLDLGDFRIRVVDGLFLSLTFMFRC